MTKEDLRCLANSFYLLASVVLGMLVLYVHNNLLPYIYCAFAICVIIGQKGYYKIDKDLLFGAWLLLAMFPVPFLLYYQDIILSVIYVMMFCGYFVIQKNYPCKDIGNEWCLICKRRK